MKWMKNLVILCLAVSTSVFAADKYEAEDATYGKDIVVVSSTSASGNAYLKMQDGDGNIEFSVSVSTKGPYSITIHYSGPTGDKVNYLEVNGTKASEITFYGSNNFTDVSTIVRLESGENKISITKSWGWINVDYITVESFPVDEFNTCKSPITANATASARKLYNFLVNNFQKKTISGIMVGDLDNFTSGSIFTEQEDVQAVYTRSGKYPALVGLDWMFATGGNAQDSWFKTYNSKILDMARSVWANGAIPAFTWHWRPGSETNFYTSSVNSTNYTDFDFTKAFIFGSTTWDTLSTTYKTLVSDIDIISEHFLDLQEDGVAAIFRPLHEAGGTWFWWSTHTSKQYAALYKLVYERMVLKNGVHNLVWVFNPQVTSYTNWTPGETYYDVLSVDVYNLSNDHSSNSSAFYDLMKNFGNSKILALSENGPIPDVTNMHEDQTVWSWWMPWYQSWEGKYPDKTSNSVWTENMTDERIITLDKMPGWSKYTAESEGPQDCPVTEENTNYGESPKEDPGTNYKMAIDITEMSSNGIFLTYKNVPDLTNATSISFEAEDIASGSNEGMWIGLAFLQKETWTFEQVNDGCYINPNTKKVCILDITSYTDTDDQTQPTDLNNIYSIYLILSSENYTGTIIIDNMVTDNGLVISNFNDSKGLFTYEPGSSDDTESRVYLYEPISEELPSFSGFTETRATSRFSITGNHVALSTPVTGQARIDIFSMTGKRVTTLFHGILKAGSHTFKLSDLPKGQYIIRAKTAGGATTHPVVIK